MKTKRKQPGKKKPVLNVDIKPALKAIEKIQKDAYVSPERRRQPLGPGPVRPRYG